MFYSCAVNKSTQQKKNGLNFNFIFFSKTRELGVGGFVNLKIKKLWPKLFNGYLTNAETLKHH